GCTMKTLRGAEYFAAKRMRDHDVIGNFDSVHVAPPAHRSRLISRHSTPPARPHDGRATTPRFRPAMVNPAQSAADPRCSELRPQINPQRNCSQKIQSDQFNLEYNSLQNTSPGGDQSPPAVGLSEAKPPGTPRHGSRRVEPAGRRSSLPQ